MSLYKLGAISSRKLGFQWKSTARRWKCHHRGAISSTITPDNVRSTELAPTVSTNRDPLCRSSKYGPSLLVDVTTKMPFSKPANVAIEIGSWYNGTPSRPSKTSDIEVMSMPSDFAAIPAIVSMHNLLHPKVPCTWLACTGSHTMGHASRITKERRAQDIIPYSSRRCVCPNGHQCRVSNSLS